MRIDLLFNPTGLLVGSWLFCIEHLPCLVSFWSMLRDGVQVCIKNILYWFIEGQTRLGMPRGIQMSLALTVPK